MGEEAEKQVGEKAAVGFAEYVEVRRHKVWEGEAVGLAGSGNNTCME